MSSGSGANHVKLYNSRAHVFTINPVTKNSWLPVVEKDQAIPISFIATVSNDDLASNGTIKRGLKLVGFGDNGEVVFEGNILLKTVFNRRSQKFGQWVDQSGTLHGLGFDEESELNEFMATFQTLQRNILSQPPAVTPQPNQPSSHPPSAGDVQAQLNPSQGERLAWNQTTNNNNNINNNNNNNNFSETNGRCQSAKVSPVSQSEWQLREQLKYENERLKQALEESSKNAGVWQNELHNLRTNNAKLTQALQESKIHVEEWERELLSLRDENKELKIRIGALESANESDMGDDQQKDLQKYKSCVDEFQSELRRKENEIEELQKAMEELEVRSKSNVQNGQSNDSLLAQVNSHQRHKLDIINAKLKAKISELDGIQKEYAQIIDSRDDMMSIKNYG